MSWVKIDDRIFLNPKFRSASDGAPLKEAIGSIAQHYKTPSSAVGSLRGFNSSGIVKGVMLIDGRLFLRKAA
jgi:hypothetical protein